MLCNYMGRVFSVVSFLVIIIVLLSSSSASAFTLFFLHTFHTLLLKKHNTGVLDMYIFLKAKSEKEAWPA